MKLFLETANLDEIAQAAELGILDGVLTSAALAAREKAPFRSRLLEVCRRVEGPVSVEVAPVERRAIVTEAQDLRRIAPNLVIRLPAVKDGLKACKKLTEGGAIVHVAMCFQPLQALAAAKAGATFVSPYLAAFHQSTPLAAGAEHAAETEIETTIQNIRRIFDNYRYTTQILATGIRTAADLVQVALAGADAAAVPFVVIDEMLANPLTGADLGRLLGQIERD